MSSLTHCEDAILQRQLHFPETKPTYLGVFRYATISDLLIISVSTVCSFIAGGLIPLPPVGNTGLFS